MRYGFMLISLLSVAHAEDLRGLPGVPFPVPEASSAGSSLSDDILKVRDPFRMPEIQAARTVVKSNLEKFSLDELKLVGVSTGPKNVRALILSPDGKTYFVSERMKIGTHNGVIVQITPDLIKIREKMINVIGQEESSESELLMAHEGQAVKEAGLEKNGMFLEGSSKENRNLILKSSP